MQTTQLDKSLCELLPRLNENEYSLLEKDILENGIRDPILVTELDEIEYVIDGYARLSIAEKYNLQYETKTIILDSIQEAEQYIINSKLSRKNLSQRQYKYFLGNYCATELRNRGANTPTAKYEILAKELGISKQLVHISLSFYRSLAKLSDYDSEIIKLAIHDEIEVYNINNAQRLAAIFNKDEEKGYLLLNWIKSLAHDITRTERGRISKVLIDLYDTPDLTNSMLCEYMDNGEWPKPEDEPIPPSLIKGLDTDIDDDVMNKIDEAEEMPSEDHDFILDKTNLGVIGVAPDESFKTIKICGIQRITYNQLFNLLRILKRDEGYIDFTKE